MMGFQTCISFQMWLFWGKSIFNFRWVYLISDRFLYSLLETNQGDRWSPFHRIQRPRGHLFLISLANHRISYVHPSRICITDGPWMSLVIENDLMQEIHKQIIDTHAMESRTVILPRHQRTVLTLRTGPTV